MSLKLQDSQNPSMVFYGPQQASDNDTSNTGSILQRRTLAAATNPIRRLCVKFAKVTRQWTVLRTTMGGQWHHQDASDTFALRKTILRRKTLTSVIPQTYTILAYCHSNQWLAVQFAVGDRLVWTNVRKWSAWWAKIVS